MSFISVNSLGIMLFAFGLIMLWRYVVNMGICLICANEPLKQNVYRVMAYDGVVTVVEPESSLFDLKMYVPFFPLSKKRSLFSF